MSVLLAVVIVWVFGFAVGRHFERRRSRGPLDISQADLVERLRRSNL